jgi:hypothetical protein
VHKGNLAVIGFGWGFVVILALTAIVYVIAMRVRLPHRRVQRYVDDAAHEANANDPAVTP